MKLEDVMSHIAHQREVRVAGCGFRRPTAPMIGVPRRVFRKLRSGRKRTYAEVVMREGRVVVADICRLRRTDEPAWARSWEF